MSVNLTCTGLYCWIADFKVLDCCEYSFEMYGPPLPSLDPLLTLEFFLSRLTFMFRRYLGLAVNWWLKLKHQFVVEQFLTDYQA